MIDLLSVMGYEIVQDIILLAGGNKLSYRSTGMHVASTRYQVLLHWPKSTWYLVPGTKYRYQVPGGYKVNDTVVPSKLR